MNVLPGNLIKSLSLFIEKNITFVWWAFRDTFRYSISVTYIELMGKIILLLF